MQSVQKKSDKFLIPKPEIVFGHKIIQLLLSAIFLACTTVSCNKNPDPTIETIEYYNFNNNQRNEIAIGGEYLKDSIFINVQNRIAPLQAKGFKVEFEILSGGGSVDKPEVVTGKNGRAATRWKLGTKSFYQQADAKIYSPDGKFLSKMMFSAYGVLYNAWNEVNYPPLSQLSDLVADTVSQQSWMISINKVYKRGANFLDWQPVNEPKLIGAREIEIDKNGVVYIGNWKGELYKSTDHGISWIKCTNPIPDRPYYFYFWITNDGDLWATVYDRGIWHSKDGGMTWTNPNKDFMDKVFRLKSGSLISLISPVGERQLLRKSDDDGKTWTLLETPGYPFSYFVTEKEDIIVCTQGMQAGIHKSTDLGKTFSYMHGVPVTFGTSSLQTYFHKYGSFYYMLIPGYGVLKTIDFEKFETFFSEPNVNGLYIDHTGSLAVSGTMTKLNTCFYFGKN